ncbi:MAG: hypothetical protein MK538_05310 [Planctomycetes bacterium]|nr:hypothetical protein [Planctomycetota bacterium]
MITPRGRRLVCVVAVCLVSGVTSSADPVDVIEESFSDSRLPKGWVSDSGQWRVEEGRLLGEKRDEAGVIRLAGESWDAFRIVVDVHLLKSWRDDAELGVVFALSAGSGHQPITFHDATPGEFSHVVVGSDSSQFVRVDGDWKVKAGADGDPPGGKSIHLEIEVGGGRVRCHADQHVVLDSPFASDAKEGGIGLFVAGSTASFDNLRVRSLTRAEISRLRVSRAESHRPVIIAHRGASRRAPENTLSALRFALESGAEACEFDVRRTRDGRLVLIHDATLERTTNFRQVFGPGEGPARVEALTLAELQRLDAGSWRSEEYRDEKIPTLQEALAMMKGAITPVIEIKAEGIGRDVAQAIREAGMESEVFVLSFSPETIKEVRRELNGTPIGLLFSQDRESDPVLRATSHMTRARRAGASAVVCHYSSVGPEYLREMHRRAMAVWAYTVNDVTLIEMLRDMGVDGIVTDVPAAALQARERVGVGSDDVAAGQSSGTGKNQGGLGSSPRQVMIARGEIPILDFARYYSDASGLPLVLGGGEVQWTDQTVHIAADMDRVAPVLVKSVLSENGYSISERRLRNGRRIVLLTAVRGRSTATPVVEKPSVVVDSDGSAVSDRRPGQSTTTNSTLPERRARPESIEYKGLLFEPVPELLVKQTLLRPGTGVLLRMPGAERRQPSAVAEVVEDCDVVTHVAFRRVNSPEELRRSLDRHAIGEAYYLSLLRNGRELIVRVGGKAGR